MKTDEKMILKIFLLFYSMFVFKFGRVIKFRMVQMGRIYRNEIIEKIKLRMEDNFN